MFKLPASGWRASAEARAVFEQRYGHLASKDREIVLATVTRMLAASVPDPVLLPGWAGEPKLWAAGFALSVVHPGSAVLPAVGVVRAPQGGSVR